MKKIIFIGVSSLCFVMVFSCRKALKNVEDYYPALITSSATVTLEGTVEVSAEVSSTGNGDLHYIGFCMDTVPNPNMMSNQQVVVELNGNTFSTVYDQKFDPAKTYYFRSWAANAYGYVYGNTIALTNVKATPIVAPCTLNENSSNIGIMGSTGTGPKGSAYRVSAVDHFSSTWDITCTGYDASAGTLQLKFGSDLKTKVFTTTNSNAWGDMVLITVSSGFSSGTVDSGSKVYVNQLSPGVYEITICDAPWTLSGSTSGSRLNARFVSPLK